MTHQFYKFKPGQCVCLLGDPVGGASRVNVRKLSGEEAVLDPSVPLHRNQFIYTTLKLEDGPSLALAGVVVTTASGGIYIQWSHSKPEDADRIDRTIQEYLARSKGEEGAAPPAPSRLDQEPAVAKAGSEREEPADTSAEPKAEEPAAASSGSKTPDKAPPLAKGGSENDTEAIEPEALPQDTSSRPKRGKGAAGKRSSKKPAPPAAAKKGADGAAQTAAPREAQAGARKGIDVGEHIRRNAKRVRSADLASRVDIVQVLDMGTIRTLIKDAVEDSVALLGPTIREEERKRLLEETEESFKERLEVFRSEKADFEQRTKLLQDKLEQAQAVLEAERRSVLSSRQFTVSDAGMVELEQRLGRVLDHALRSGNPLSPELEREMRAMVSRLLDDEREKIQKEAQEAQSDKIALLEKKVERLASSLQSAEKERDKANRRASALEASGVIAFGNVMEAGLDDEDPDRELKLKLLNQIIEFNKEVRQQLVAAGRKVPVRVRPEGGGKAARPAGADLPAEGAAPSPEEVAPPSEEAAPLAEAAAPPDGVGAEDVLPEEGPCSEEDAPESAEVDPDDLPWEPGVPSKEAEVRRLDGVKI